MNGPAARLQLRTFDLISKWPEQAVKTKEDFDSWLGEMGLMWTQRLCVNCRNQMVITKQGGGSERWKWECCRRSCRAPGIPRKIGYLVGTFFEKGHADRKSVFMIAYLWVNDAGGTADRSAELTCLSKPTVLQWEQYFRDVIVENFNNPAQKIGGPGVVISVDETCVVRRKHDVGRLVRTAWLVGGVEEGTKKCFVELVQTRDARTLENVMQAHVHPGTIIHTDCWAGYGNLGNIGYIHRTVNHSMNFVNPANGVHTQQIESLWSQLKRGIRMRNGLNGQLWDDHFYEVLWKWQKKDESLLYDFWELVSAKYPVQ